MADYGFGTGEFGAGQFGTSDLSRDALWELSVPQRNKDDDALVGGDLEDFLEMVGWMVDDAMQRAREFPLQGDPVTALSGIENRVTLNFTDVEVIDDGQIRVTIDTDEREMVEPIFSQSVDSDGVPRRDGWLAVIQNEFYRITRVRAHDTEATPYGAPTIDIRTPVGLGEVLVVQPPDLLTLLGTNVGVLVDKADPPDYTRRNILRHRLLRDLKVSGRLFDVLGRLTGFDVTAKGLYCITEGWYQSLRLSDPLNAYQYNGRFFTDVDLYGFFFDEIPADVVPLDTFNEPAEIGPLQIANPVEESTNYWCMEVTPVEDVCQALELGHWQLRDAPDPLLEADSVVFDVSENFVVPDGVTQLTVSMVAGGGSGPLNGSSSLSLTNGTGGGGGFVRATIDVTPGETLFVIVGEGGHDATDFLGGIPGGGQAATVPAGRDTGGAGGGYSALKRGSNFLLIAGAGGGAGWSVSGTANAAGGAGGNAPEDGTSTGDPANRGRGASTVAGGAGGTGTGENGNAGSALTGAPGFTTTDPIDGGGGGGAGWFGGGSGAADVDGAGGGGGSSFVPDPTAVDITYLDGAGPTPGGVSEPEYQAGAGEGGGPGQAGGNGFVVVSWDDVPDTTGEGTARYIEELEDTDIVGEDTGVDTDGSTGPFAVTSSLTPIKPGSLTIFWTDSGGTQRSASDDGFGLILGEASGTVDYNAGAISITTDAATEVGTDILLDYAQKRVCVISAEEPNEGEGALLLQPHFVCRSDYKRAAAYRVVATPDQVLEEPGVDFSRLVDRMEQKIDKYVPIHIRLLVKVFKTQTALEVFGDGEPELTAQDTLTDTAQVNPVGGTLFDVVAADVQPLDEGIFLVEAQFKFNESNWLAQDSGTTEQLEAVTGYNDGSSRFWAVGDAGTVLVSSDGGQTWAADGLFPTILDDVTGVDNDFDKSGGTGNVVACSEDANLTTNAGKGFIWDAAGSSWIGLDNAAVDRGFLDCAMSGESNSGNFGRNALFVGYDGRMFYNEQTTDVLTLTGSGVTTETLRGCDMIDAADNTFAVGDNGTLLHVTSWGANPAGIWGDETWSDVSGLLGTTEGLKDVAFNISAVLEGIIVGDNDAVFITLDQGDSWSAVPTNSGKNFVTALWGDFQSETGEYRVWIFADDGTSYVSDDLGVTWVEEHHEESEPIRGSYNNATDLVAVGDSGAVWTEG